MEVINLSPKVFKMDKPFFELCWVHFAWQKVFNKNTNRMVNSVDIVEMAPDEFFNYSYTVCSIYV